MGKFVLVYKGGTMAETEEERNEVMARWGAWFQGLGDSVVDMGNPFSESKSVSSSGSNGAAASGLGGYSIINASSLDDAAGMVGGCPILEAGGDVEVYETIQM
ncbi:MAG TPA: hypothetical protein VG265_02240 [Gaiellaceae bacterium]|jgi:hypothetical protein|nr:hypothetical protein [Gaiellaceae bacterium]